MVRKSTRKSKAQRGGDWGDFTNWLKQNKVISKAGRALGGMIPGIGGTIASGVGNFADQYGYGKKRRAPRRLTMRGGAGTPNSRNVNSNDFGGVKF